VVALVFGILRKEMALQMLMVLFGTSNLALHLTPEQMFTFALVMAVFMPCLAAWAVMLKEFGLKSTLLVTAGSISLAMVMGAASHLFLSL
jgi:ferrous iron transport protein B